MSAASTLVEVAVRVAAPQAELAEFAVGEYSPGGFQQEEHPDGSASFAVFVPSGDEHVFTTYLAGAGIELVDAPRVTPVPSDWDQRWKAFHQAVVIGDLWVGPPWQEDSAGSHLKRVVIEPAQGFGTGAHPTTRLVLSLLQEQPRSSVLDLGCGSGVLSVAAALLGFAPITGIDNDPVAVESTNDNLERNGIRGVTVRCMDALQQPLPDADLVLANVILEPLVRLAPQMRAPRLILSGLLRSQVDTCVEAYAAAGYVLRERRDRDGWSALVLDDAKDTARAMQHRPVF